MFRIILSVFLTFFFLKCVIAEKPANNQPDSNKDTYLKAYVMTKKLNKKSDFNGFYSHDFHGYPDDGFDYGPPEHHYGPPEHHYGPPIHHHGPPVHHYGPPKPIYGPPIPYPPPQYGPYPPPPPPAPEPVLPHALLGIIDKIKYKIDLLTIGKIILKLVIFKKIVAWIGIICLLLFIPSLKNKNFFLGNNNNNMGEDDLLRSYNSRNSDVDERISNLGNFIMDSIGAFSRKYQNESDCHSIYCKSQRFQKYIDEKLTYGKLAKLYSKEL